jgi:hypothetical protein
MPVTSSRSLQVKSWGRLGCPAAVHPQGQGHQPPGKPFHPPEQQPLHGPRPAPKNSDSLLQAFKLLLRPPVGAHPRRGEPLLSCHAGCTSCMMLRQADACKKKAAVHHADLCRGTMAMHALGRSYVGVFRFTSASSQPEGCGLCRTGPWRPWGWVNGIERS